MTAVPPVIIIGAPRSGTTLLARILARLGVRMGWRQTPTAEALLFQDLNKWMYAHSGATVENPIAVRYLADDAHTRRIVGQVILTALHSPWAASYLGWWDYVRYRSPMRLPAPWGWKDPRNTFTLPVWLDVFPLARVVHIARHGVDVAASEKELHDRSLERMRSQMGRWGRLYLRYLTAERAARRQRLVDPRVATLEGGLTLWEEYMAQARRQLDRLAGRTLEIQFETLVTDPDAVLPSLAGFCSVPLGPGAAARVKESIDAGRAYAYRRSDALREFAARTADRLRAYGY